MLEPLKIDSIVVQIRRDNMGNLGDMLLPLIRIKNPQLSSMGFFSSGRKSRGKRAISVRATEGRLYSVPNKTGKQGNVRRHVVTPHEKKNP